MYFLLVITYKDILDKFIIHIQSSLFLILKLIIPDEKII